MRYRFAIERDTSAAVAPERIFESTHTPEIFFSHFDERFRDGHYTVYSLVSFLFAVLFTVPLVTSHLQKWGHVPPCPWSRRHCQLCY